MDLSRIKIGIIHTMMGKNDGVSIVIDQTIEAMVHYMDIPLGNIYFLAAMAPPSLNKTENEILWHKNENNVHILKNYKSKKSPPGFEKHIIKHATHAKKVIEEFVDKNELDMLLIHNSCHPTNFIYSVGAGLYFEELQKRNQWLPRYLIWWHDSHLERERFANPNPVIKKFLKYLPGNFINGAVFINSQQQKTGDKYFKDIKLKNYNHFFTKKTAVIPNTCDIPWDWKRQRNKKDKIVAPPNDRYNDNFFRDIGLVDRLKKRGYTMKDAVILLQHTRIVERKRIDVAIDFAIKLEEKFLAKGENKCVVLLVSGHSGDEGDSYLNFLKKIYFEKIQKSGKAERKNVIVLFAENYILPEREKIMGRKLYRFRDIPGLVAAHGGLGTYFSDVEGYGNNLLEMVSMGLPTVINRYPIYDSDIAPLGFKLPATKNPKLPAKLIDECYEQITNIKKRNEVVLHNLNVLETKLHHRVVAEALTPIFQNIFKYE